MLLLKRLFAHVYVISSIPFLYYEFAKTSIWPLDEIITGSNTWGQSGSVNNTNE